MTKKDYELIARALSAARQDVGRVDCTPVQALHLAAARIGRALATDNPRFDMGRFLEAASAS